MRIFAAFGALRDPRFARLYAAQTVSQVGDALTWVALALLAYELAGADAAVVLGVALTLRVSAYVLLSPWGVCWPTGWSGAPCSSRRTSVAPW